MRWQEMFKVNNDDTATASIDFIYCHDKIQN